MDKPHPHTLFSWFAATEKADSNYYFLKNLYSVNFTHSSSQLQSTMKVSTYFNKAWASKFVCMMNKMNQAII